MCGGFGSCGGCGGNQAVLGGCGVGYQTPLQALAAVACNPFAGCGYYPAPRPTNTGVVPPGTPGSGWSVQVQQSPRDVFSQAIANGQIGGVVNFSADAQIDVGPAAQISRYNLGMGDAVGQALGRMLFQLMNG
jgi:hypothetical protein